MGRERLSLECTASASRHNSPRDDADNASWNRFAEGVRRLAAEISEESGDQGIEIDLWGDMDLPIDQWS
jgi:hypothetical protein